MNAPKLHNAMWPGLVGKGDDEGQEPPISLEHMLDLSADAEVDGQKFDGIDYFLFLPHTDPEATDDELKGIADLIAGKGFDIGSLVAPIWPGTVGDSAMGTAEQRAKFLDAVKMACRIAKIFNEHGARKYGVIRIDSAEFGVEKWREDMAGAVVCIGNAPTALFRLLEMLGSGAPKPAVILGFPVGFVGAAESKQALIDDAGDIPYLTLRGRRGGSAIAGAAVNALARIKV